MVYSAGNLVVQVIGINTDSLTINGVGRGENFKGNLFRPSFAQLTGRHSSLFTETLIFQKNRLNSAAAGTPPFKY